MPNNKARRELRKLTAKIKDDATLHREAANGEHARRQRIKDTMNILTIVVMVGFCILVAILGIAWISHLIAVKDWSTIEKILYSAISAGIGYVIAELRRNGITKEG